MSTVDTDIIQAAREKYDLDDLQAARIRRSVRELGTLAPDLVEELFASPKHGPILLAACADRIKWTCPLCETSLFSPTPPPGWHILEPFTRVASCDRCTPHFGSHL